MEVYINDELKEISENTNITQLVDQLDMKRKKGIAVAVDNQVVTRDLWDVYYPKPKSRIVIIKAVQGG